ncbi:restriction endonuclease [Planctomycetales bacterium]|nr:restriction endonuclease [Planctomycetales bacterium]
MSNCQYEIAVPLTKTSGKVRVKQRKLLYEYGLPVATRSTNFALNHYIEWQIGYDAVVADANKLAQTSLPDCTFIGANGKKKALFELSEYVFHCAKNGLLHQADIVNLRDFIEAIAEKNLLDNTLEITRSHPKPVEINRVVFEKSTVQYPLLVHKFGDFDIVAEIIAREKQYAVGIMPMLYLCFPLTKLVADTPLIGRPAKQNEVAKLLVDAANAPVFLEIFRLFGMLSAAHRHDILEILKVIIAHI